MIRNPRLRIIFQNSKLSFPKAEWTSLSRQSTILGKLCLYLYNEKSCSLIIRWLNLLTGTNGLNRWITPTRKCRECWGESQIRKRKRKKNKKKHWNFAKKDPNGMDVDAMTTEERTEAMKKGLCFGCGKHRHLN